MGAAVCTGFETGSLEQLLSNSGAVLVSTPTRGDWSDWAIELDGLTDYALFAFTDDDEVVTPLSEFYFHAGMQATQLYDTGSPLMLFQSPDGTTQCCVYGDGAGHLQLRRGTGTVLATGATLFGENLYLYLTGHVVISNAAGVMTLEVNGAAECSVSGVDTQQHASDSTADRVRLQAISGTPTYWDDILVHDTADQGDVRLTAYRPNAAGDQTGMTRGGTDSGTNYGQVDDATPNTSDYAYGVADTEYDLYNIPNTAETADIIAARLWLYAWKDDAGAANIAHAWKSESIEDFGPDFALSTTPSYHGRTYSVDPVDAAALSVAKLNALQIGAKSR